MEQLRRNPRETRALGPCVALVLASLVTGCPGPEPYNGGTYVYDGYGTIERDPACKLTGNLQLSLGEGDGTNFLPLAPGQEPVVYHGPQGGSHLILGLSVANPATEFPGLQVQFLLQRQRCLSGTDCRPPDNMGREERLVSDPARFLPQEGGAVSVSGILVLLGDWNPNESRRIQVQALDRCGRAGVTSMLLGPPGDWP
jgi:hypothetical protein